MAYQVYFDNRQIVLPGAYSTIVSGETNPARTTDYGKVLLLDCGTGGAGFGGGAGINGQLASGQDAIYSFGTLENFRFYVKGGIFWKIAEKLFIPDSSNRAAGGISELYYIRCCTTTAATLTMATAAGGTFKFFTRDEGLWANAVLSTDTTPNLISGYAYQIVPGVRDTTKFIMKIYRGTFTGLAADGLPYGDETEAQVVPQLMVQSPEFNNVQTLIDWSKNDSNFNQYFAPDPSSTVEGEGEVTASDVTALAGWQKAEGATETYKPTDVDNALGQITGLDYNIIFTDQQGAKASGSITQKVITHINTVSKFDRFLYVAGYGQASEFADSLALAQGFDSDRIVCVHGDAGMNTELSPTGYRWWSPLYMTAAVIGRVSGKPPYVPPTNKSIGIDRVKHILSDDEKKQSLESGLLVVTKNDFIRKFVILQGVNTLQDNAYLFNSKGQSYSIQFMRIVAQINRELVVNSEIDLLSQENGVNATTLSTNIVKNWTTAYLQSRVATEAADNLLLSFQDVTATRQEDAIFVTYSIVVNSEINKLFFTGYLIR